jgi:hypothetical protein
VTPEARAARERKQKIFVVVGGLFLVALLAIQLPKLLGGSSSSSSSANETTTTPQAESAATPVALSGAAPAPAPATAKLRSFTVFARKDPFVQQVVTQNGSAAASGEGEGDGAKGSEKGESSKSTAASKSFSTGTEAAAAAVTIVTVNGARQVLQPGMKFPAGDPLFVLVAEKPSSKSVVVGIVGGAYTGGRKTATLRIGKPLKLVNTTTGASYKISLVSVGTGQQAQLPEQPPSRP